MVARGKTREQLIEEIKVLKTRIAQLERSQTSVKKLKAEVKKLKDELKTQTWGLKKTSENIKLLYKELETKNRELQRLDNLKSDFVATVSHELRTPLTIVQEGIALINDKILGDVNEKQVRTLSQILENIARLTRIINDLLDISKLEAGEIELKKSYVDTAKFIKKIIEDFQSKAKEKKIVIKASLSKKVSRIYADNDKLIQILTNLVSNSLKFTPENGKITVKAGDDADGSVMISVSDTGVGMSGDDMSKLFNKFQQFDRVPGPGEKGTGLGLAISKKIVELHGGRIWAESEINKGSTFYFTIPKCGIPETGR
ncbi:MAG: ATP-binding protein [Candidatus Auribacterota bacterium]|nr:ATP-binding protein [Candidatus Auribacterota bacterium]